MTFKIVVTLILIAFVYWQSTNVLLKSKAAITCVRQIDGRLSVKKSLNKKNCWVYYMNVFAIC